ncbi:MAG: UDP-N-acetylglucosamine 2-epimerase (non-hydrolyzing) [Saprospiraceae bacterium]|nr:UDP-N-acetylglucosamine 2-epimerase (non-hydrolyzing) [Saprospiraceae bacterium]
MKQLKILSVVGARPNFMKVAPLHRAFLDFPALQHRIVHTGQHYDTRMSTVFFEQLELPVPDHFLGINGGSHTAQTARIMLAFEAVLIEEKPDWVLVVGDVNSTLACALTAAKMNIPVAHVEAGLRSGDREMPEEINRILTDALSSLLFVTEASALENLSREGVAAEKVIFSGNCMIDSLVFYQKKSAAIHIPGLNQIAAGAYILVTLHRPSNVDSPEGLENVVIMLERIAPLSPMVFPIHPRTRQKLQQFDLMERINSIPQLQLLEPQGYLEFLHLLKNARVVLTDSGGVQEESTFLQIPCLTFRRTTERPVTISLGTNELMAELDPHQVAVKVADILNGRWKKGQIPPLWDGHAARRIAEVFDKLAEKLF